MSALLTARHASWQTTNLLSSWEVLQPAWDEFVLKHPKGSVFHSSPMVRVFDSAKGHTVLPLAAVTASGEIQALLVAVRVQTLPSPMGRLSSRSIFYAEPLCYDNPASVLALQQLLDVHVASVRRTVLYCEIRPLFASGPEREAIESCSYEYLEHLNYLVDVTKSLRELWASLHRTARQAISQCQRKGLAVREVEAERAVDQLYPLLQQSFDHSGIPLADKSLFEAAARKLHPHGLVKFFAAYEGPTPVAMDVLLTFKDRVYFWYAGVNRSTSGSPCSLLRWHEIQWAHENGYAVCDMGGAGWPGIPYGVRNFKRKFGGQLVQYGRFRKVNAPWTLALAERAYQLRRAAHLGKRSDSTVT